MQKVLKLCDEQFDSFIGFRFVPDFNQLCRFDLNRRFSLQAQQNIVSAFAPALGNSFSQQFRSTENRNHNDGKSQLFCSPNHATRHIDNDRSPGQQNIQDVRPDAVIETVRMPAHSKMILCFFPRKLFGRDGIVILGINLSGARDNALWKYEIQIARKVSPRRRDERVLAAAGRADNEN